MGGSTGPHMDRIYPGSARYIASVKLATHQGSGPRRTGTCRHRFPTGGCARRCGGTRPSGLTRCQKGCHATFKAWARVRAVIRPGLPVLPYVTLYMCAFLKSPRPVPIRLDAGIRMKSRVCMVPVFIRFIGLSPKISAGRSISVFGANCSEIAREVWDFRT